MSFDTVETSTSGGRPVELYQIEVEGATYRFTNSEGGITKDGLEFKYGAIIRESVEQSNKSVTGQFALTMSLDDPNLADFLNLWVVGVPEDDAEVTIFKQHIGDSEFITFWSGKILEVSFSSNAGEFLLSNVGSFFSDKGPRMTWGGHCSHNFGDDFCGVVLSGFTRTLNITSVAADGVTITISGLSTGQTDGDYIRGELRKGSFGRRYIARHVGDVVTLAYPLTGLVAGDSVELIEGCPHNVTECDSRFSNSANFGGVPYTPNINIFERGLEKA